MDAKAPTGHRRRRSSLIYPANSAAARPRDQSIRSTVVNAQEEPKILEEEEDEDEDEDENDVREAFPAAHDDAGLTDEDLHDDEETGLTRKDRRRKKQKRSANTLLDQRIVRQKLTDQEKKQADQSVCKNLLINCALIGLWYIFSLCISIYNKWMFDPKSLNFPLPLFTTSVHMLVQFCLASFVLLLFPSLRPQKVIQKMPGQPRRDTDPKQPLMTKMFYLTRIGPCGAATSLDIGLGNTSLKFVTLTFYTMCKSSSLAFVLLFAFLFRLESPTWKLVAVIATMTMGVVMMVAGEVEFRLAGFVLVISAAFFSGFRWGLTQILLLRNPATSNPFSSIFFLAPVMFLTLFVIAIPVEGFGPLMAGLQTLRDEFGVLATLLLIVFPGTMAFFMTASEFALLRRTSVVTLSIAGIFKEAVTISAAAIVFGDRLTPVNISGLFITLGSIAGYNWIKIAKMRSEALVKAQQRSHADQASPGLEGSRGTSAYASLSGSDAEGGEGGEEAGLLGGRQGVQEMDGDVLFTVDGDAIPQLELAPIAAGPSRAEQKAGRED
ncbi:hypothetical protein P8C59_007800 [Phyllachora maydis]|uniref:Sugar phosphate transporter domain-containing protein n=1 Tax=Phyllachora maydis TaxID=1825666 RepID=A0AAD9I941_9PEZI|nr:hypothetical protein P8C59_007800 [Phyllachora maydis]